jgi:hypothetical protein
MVLEHVEPGRELEAVDDGDRREELWGQCRLLRGDDDSGGKMALLADDGEEVLVNLVASPDLARKCRMVSA